MKRKNILIWITLLLIPQFIFAQKGIVNNGAKIIVTENAKILIKGGSDASYTNKSEGSNHGRIDLDGKIELEGNWLNNASSGEVLINLDNDGEIHFSGLSSQTIGGTANSSFEELVLNNTSGASLNRSVFLNNGLTLTNGSLNINSYNLSFGSNAIATGTFGPTRMVVANGSGQVLKYFTNTGSFTFPIGDNTSTTEYSPIEFSLTGYSGLSSAYISAKVTDAKHPENTSPSEFLTRYWTVNQSGITNPEYNANFYYKTTDIVGTEAEIYSAKYNGSVRTVYDPVDAANDRMVFTGMTSFSEFTGVNGSNPSVVLSSTQYPITNASPIVVTVEFSEEVQNFTSTDIAISSGNITSFSTTDDITWTAEITPTEDATITINIPAGVAQDLAGNDNTAATALSVEYDATAPTVSIASAEPNPTNSSPFIVDIDFNEHINDFALADILVTNGTKGVLSTITEGLSYTLEIIPSNGSVTVDIATEAVTDDAGNGNIVADQFSIVYDGIAPEVTLSTTEPSPTNSSFTVTIEFSEEVNGFALEDVDVTNGNPASITPIVPNQEFTVLINPIADDLVIVTVNADVAADDAGNGNNAAATPIEIVYDQTSPTLAITTAETQPATNSNPFTATFSFSEGVVGFTSSDISVSNATISGFTATDYKTFTADINPLDDGEINIQVNANIVQDSAGNNNVAAIPYIIDYDGTAPTAEIASAVSNPTNEYPFSITITFSEEIDELLEGEVDITNATVSNLVTNDNIVYTANITPTGDGDIIIEIPASVANDIAGNPNAQSDPFATYYDGTVPTVAISSLESDPTNNAPFEISIDFSEPVVGFNIGDLSVNNASIDNLQTVNNQNYTAFINPIGDNTITVDIASGVAQDDAGNPNDAATTFSIDFDGTQPLVEITSGVLDPTNTAFLITVSFNEDVTSFDLSDLHVTNGSASNLVNTTPNQVWTADITPVTDGDVIIDIMADSAFDLAGNGNLPASFSVEYDITNPDIAALNPENNATNVATTAVLEINFNENVVIGTGNIEIRLDSDNSLIESISVASGQVVHDGFSTVTITPTNPFVSQELYYILLDATAFDDVAGNSFAGITSTTDWRFEIIDINNPSIVSVLPVDNSADVAVNTDLEITFSENVYKTTSGNIIVYTSDDDLPFETIPVTSSFVTGDGTSTITIDMQNLMEGQTGYYVLIDGGAFEDSDNNSFAGITSKYFWNFTTEDIDPPLVQFFTPANGSGGVLVGSNLEIEFNEIVNKQSGNIEIRRVSDNALFESIDVASAQVSGDGSTIIQIDPLSDLASQTEYYVIIPSTAFDDDNGNYYAGISGTSDWAFTTEDNVDPTVSISTLEPPLTNASPFEIEITFDEEVSGFSAGDIAISNGSAANLLTADYITFTVDITPDLDGSISVYIPAGVALDLSGNPNEISNTINLDFDGTQPEVYITSTEPNPTSNSPFTVNVAFTESVSDFDISDLVIDNGSASNMVIITPDEEWSFDITPVADGDVTVDVPADAAYDAASNGNIAASTFTIYFDGAPPVALISSLETSPTNNSPFQVNFQFNENVTGFESTDIVVVNGTLSNFTTIIPELEWSAEITPTDETEITIDIPADIAIDDAGNGNTAATQFIMEYDITQPGASLATTESSPTSNTPFEISVTFTEEMSGLGTGDLSITNGSCTNISSTDNVVFLAEVTPFDEGEVLINLPTGVATDLAGNFNTASTNTLNIIFDGTAPTVEITSTVSDPTNVDPFEISVNFSEPMMNFNIDDFIIFNGVASNLNTADYQNYTANISPNNDGLVSIDINAGVATDSAGNANIAATQFSVEFDGTQPTVVITSTASNPTNISPIPITVEFSEAVVGFELSDIATNNGTVSDLFTIDNLTFTANLLPDNDGLITVDIIADAAQDEAGNGNTAAAQFTIEYNTSSPNVLISSLETNPTNSNLFELTVEFSEEITDFIIADFVVTNATISNLQSADNILFTADVAPTSDGLVEILIPANAVQDLLGNGNVQSNMFEIIYDGTNPDVIISSLEPNPTSNSPFEISVIFTEEIVGFDISDLNITNGTANNFNEIDSVTFTADITPLADGTVAVDIDADVAEDLAGNPNNAAVQFSIIYNSEAPGVDISSLESNPTNSSPFEITVEFTEEVTGFMLDDFLLSNAEVSNLQTSDNTLFTADITPNNDGEITVDIPANAATDLAGNPNTAALQFAINYDGTAPSVEIFSAEGDSTGNSPFDITIAFSEEVIGFDVTDIFVVNGSASNLQSPDNITFTADITPDEDGVVAVDVPADAVQDIAGNFNTAALQFTIFYDDNIKVAELDDPIVKIYSYESHIYVEFIDMPIPEGTIRIFNVNGQKIADQEIENNKVNKIWIDGHKAIYFVKVSTKTVGSQLEKVFVE